MIGGVTPPQHHSEPNNDEPKWQGRLNLEKMKMADEQTVTFAVDSMKRATLSITRSGVTASGNLSPSDLSKPHPNLTLYEANPIKSKSKTNERQEGDRPALALNEPPDDSL